MVDCRVKRMPEVQLKFGRVLAPKADVPAAEGQQWAASSTNWQLPLKRISCFLSHATA
jgi:hypothetical protein